MTSNQTTEDSDEWANLIVKQVFELYEGLPKKGKPRVPGEWTTLASFVLIDLNKKVDVICCATGTRCLGKTLLDQHGHRLHDSHAEVLARRAFQRYLMTQVRHTYQHGNSRMFELNEQTGKLKRIPGVEIVFCTTQTPCGDASIFPRAVEDIHPEMKRRIDGLHKSPDLAGLADELPPGGKRLRLCPAGETTKCADSTASGDTAADKGRFVWQSLLEGDYDLYRTGAKCVPGGPQDQLIPGSSYHVTGVLRTKPGRGDPTLSMSCSDKMARWNILGCQGSFPMIFLEEPIYINHVIIAGCSADKKAMERAMYDRFSHVLLPPNGGYKANKPQIHIARDVFIHSKRGVEMDLSSKQERTSPCSTALIWYKIGETDTVTEVSVDGYRQGVTKKSLNTDKARLSLCHLNMLKDLHDVFSGIGRDIRLQLINRETLPNTYQTCKDLTMYTSIWNQLTNTDNPFKLWRRKDRTYSLFELPIV